MSHYQIIESIQENEVYKQILIDSFGGIMYTEGAQEKYKSDEVLKLWNSLSKECQQSTGGIMQGVFDFLTNKN